MSGTTGRRPGLTTIIAFSSPRGAVCSAAFRLLADRKCAPPQEFSNPLKKCEWNFLAEKFGVPFLDEFRFRAGVSARVILNMSSPRLARVLVSGVSGPIGTPLVSSLRANGAQITRLVRSTSRRTPQDDATIPWDPAQPLSPDTVSGFDAVINLAGEGIVGKWTPDKKAKIRDSRVQGTHNLAQALVRTPMKPKVFVCSSAIGYYGNRADEVLTEASTPGQGFLPDVCREWEAATQPATDAGIRTVQIRTGVVLSSKGGALAEMLIPFKLGVGGKVGNGKQWMSWIDVTDMVDGIQHALNTESLRGPVNFVAPNPVRNSEFTKTLARVLSRPAIFPIPALVIKLAFGEMGQTVLLGSQRVQPTQLLASGYSFQFNNLRASLEHILKS